MLLNVLVVVDLHDAGIEYCNAFDAAIAVREWTKFAAGWCGLLCDHYRRSDGWNLYFFEVMTDQQTLGFHPELYLDIEAVRETKKQACLCHESQHPEGFWAVHEQMHVRRGAECGVEYAEAYSLVEAKPGRHLLPVQFLPRRH